METNRLVACTPLPASLPHVQTFVATYGRFGLKLLWLRSEQDETAFTWRQVIADATTSPATVNVGY